MSQLIQRLNLKIPKKFEPLFPEYFSYLQNEIEERYIIIYGGRGKGASWQVARRFILWSLGEPCLLLCTRQIQRSIDDSVYALLKNQIHILGLDQEFKILNNRIISSTGSEFIFKGLYQNQEEIKSTEGIKYCWNEEGQKTTERVFDEILDPTVRIDGSKMVVTFNPDRDDDYIYDNFITHKHDNTLLIPCSIFDNPFATEVNINQMEYDRKHNPSKFKHKWLGEPITNYDTLVYRWDSTVNISEKEIHYTSGHEACVTFDFGVGDDTAIIFFHVLKVAPNQDNPMGVIIQIFDEYTNNNKTAEHYRDVIESKGYFIDRFFCDPSGHSRDSSLSSWIDKLSFNNRTGRKDWHFEYTHSYSVTEMIDHANEYMPYVKYNPHQVPGVHSMFRKWQYRTDKDDKIVLPPKPCHDEYSHYGTAWYYGMINRFKLQKHRQKATVK